MTFKAPKKSLGQNFLHDQNIIRRIIDAFAPTPTDIVVEIGPGRGALTEHLLGKVGHLHLVELDQDLATWHQKQGYGKEVSVHNTDALAFDYSALARTGKIRLIGNLPYNISTPLLFHLVAHSDVIQDMHFMLQKEVVTRMAAQPGGGDYGRLSVMMQYHCKVEPLFRVGPGAFTPAPKVDSAFVRLTPWASPPATVADVDRLAVVVRQAFSQRRKTLRNTLKGLLSEQEIRAADCDPTARAETISLEQFAALANTLQKDQ